MSRSALPAIRTVFASILLALALDAAICLFPDNPYQRFRLVDGSLFEPLRLAYERIHVDPRPVDVAVVGPSKTLFAASVPRIEQRLSELGRPGFAINLSVPGQGRNIQYVMLREVIEHKHPRAVVIGVFGEASSWGHPSFKYLAPARDLLVQPQPLLHNWLYDLAYLPTRQAKLLFARTFPELAGLPDHADPARHGKERSDFTDGVFVLDGKRIDMRALVSAAELDGQKPVSHRPSFAERLILTTLNDGDEAVYVREMVRLAESRHVPVLFVYIPVWREHGGFAGEDWLPRHGRVIDNADIAHRPELYENWEHVNHYGATIVSDRIAEAIARLPAR